MNSKISYINDRGALVLAEVDEAVVDDCISFNDVDMAHEYHHPITGKVSRLHSIGDAPALIEGPNNRKHWLWNGALHRTRGPAFTCEESGLIGKNEEYYVFGVSINSDIFEKYREYFLEVEAMAVAHGIDLVSGARIDSPAKYVLDFKYYDELTEMAESRAVPIVEVSTGNRLLMNIDEIRKELAGPIRGPGLLASAVVGVASLLLASKVRGKLASKSKRHLEAEVGAS